jgi:hypothetical protein
MIHKLQKASSRTYLCPKPNLKKYFTKVGQLNIKFDGILGLYQKNKKKGPIKYAILQMLRYGALFKCD